ncbi:Ribonuclease P protein subunit [Lachnellula occidentalis]|uniref:Ribonuclease P protein subunit n=1 Tax=Lachnellula occidentalis TaxID=215460 RepID=A0A8H8UCG2_9HELO|nr:Ribonuclease P protein subunit [Lachnellula occidentalis]
MAPKTPTPKNSDSIALSLLARAHSPTTANTILTEKVNSRPVYLKPSEPSTNAQQTRRSERARKLLTSRKKKTKPAPLSARQKRALCIYEIPKASQKYAVYEPLHRMWVGYIQEILGLEAAGTGKILPVTGPAAAKLCSADYHGAELEVVRSRCVSRVGVRGIVVRDLRGVFEVVTKGDSLKVVPKEGTVFKFTVPIPLPIPISVPEELDRPAEKVGKGGPVEEGKKDLVFELHGNQFMYRAIDRANRKFKSHFLPDL